MAQARWCYSLGQSFSLVPLKAAVCVSCARELGVCVGGGCSGSCLWILKDSPQAQKPPSPHQDLMGPLLAKEACGLVWASGWAEAHGRCPYPWGQSHLSQVLARTPTLPHADLTSSHLRPLSSCRFPGFLAPFLGPITEGLCWPLCLESPPLASSPHRLTHSGSLFVLVHHGTLP